MPDVTHNAAHSRYELQTEHGVGVAVYQSQGNRRLFTHTEIPPADEGKGLGAKLVRGALQDTRRQGLKIVPVCSFVVAYIRRHPEFDDSAP